MHHITHIYFDSINPNLYYNDLFNINILKHYIIYNFIYYNIIFYK